MTASVLELSLPRPDEAEGTNAYRVVPLADDTPAQFVDLDESSFGTNRIVSETPEEATPSTSFRVKDPTPYDLAETALLHDEVFKQLVRENGDYEAYRREKLGLPTVPNKEPRGNRLARIRAQIASHIPRRERMGTGNSTYNALEVSSPIKEPETLLYNHDTDEALADGSKQDLTERFINFAQKNRLSRRGVNKTTAATGIAVLAGGGGLVGALARPRLDDSGEWLERLANRVSEKTLGGRISAEQNSNQSASSTPEAQTDYIPGDTEIVSGLRRYFSDPVLITESLSEGENRVVRIGVKPVPTEQDPEPEVTPLAAYRNGEQILGPKPTLLTNENGVYQHCIALEWFPTLDQKEATFVYTVSTVNPDGTETEDELKRVETLFKPEFYQLTDSPLSHPAAVFVEATNGTGGFTNKETWQTVDNVLNRFQRVVPIKNIIIRDNTWETNYDALPHGEGLILSPRLEQLTKDEQETLLLMAVARALFIQELSANKDISEESAQALGLFLNVHQEINTESQRPTSAGPMGMGLDAIDQAAFYQAVFSELEQLLELPPNPQTYSDPIEGFSEVIAAMTSKPNELVVLANGDSLTARALKKLCGQAFRIPYQRVNKDLTVLQEIFSSQVWEFRNWMSVV